MRAGRLAGAAVLCAAFLLLLVPPATAHPELASSDPVQGAALAAPPARVSVTLTEPVDPVGATVQLLDMFGERRDLGDVTSTGGSRPTLSVGVPADLPDGAYRIYWRGLSTTDGHTSDGSVGFTVGGGFDAPQGTEGEGVQANAAFARFVTYAGFSLAFGAAAFLLWMAPTGYPTVPARVALLVGATLHAAGTLLFAANTAAASGITLVELASSEVGKILLLRLGVGVAAWVLALAWTFRPVAMGPAIVSVLLLGSAFGSSRLGHTFAQGPAMMALDLLHLVAAATWVGGLALLLYLVWKADRNGMGVEELRRAGIRFGTMALVCVVVLAFSGLVVAVGVLGPAALLDPVGLMASPYGGFLAGKVALAGVMVALAAVNRYVLLEGPASSGLAGGLQKVAHKATRGRLAPGLAAGRFRRTLVVEATLGVVVLLLAGFLTAAKPPVPAPEPFVVEGVGAEFRIHAEMEEPRVGQLSVMRLSITSLDGSQAVTDNTCGRPANEPCVHLSVQYGNSTAREDHHANPINGTWVVSDMRWVQAGPVTVTVAVQTATVFEDEVVLRFEVLP